MRSKVRDELGRFRNAITCDRCQIVRVNGIPLHESGCSHAWRDYKIDCKFCGSSFFPEERYQNCCSEECTKAYSGW